MDVTQVIMGSRVRTVNNVKSGKVFYKRRLRCRGRSYSTFTFSRPLVARGRHGDCINEYNFSGLINNCFVSVVTQMFLYYGFLFQSLVLKNLPLLGRQ